MSEAAVDYVVVNIDNMLNSLSSEPTMPSIFRVDDDLRSINPKSYDPEIIALGPLHRNKPQLQQMQRHKARCLKLLLRRREESSVERYVAAIRELEDRARECYAEDIQLNRDELVEMLLLDVCFIVEFLWKFQYGEWTDDDLVFQQGHVQNHLMRDLMLFENQIPFFVIECLFNMIHSDSQDSDIRSIIWPLLQNGIIPVEDLPLQVPESHPHLLGIVHDIQCSSFASMLRQIDAENGSDGNVNSATDVLPPIDMENANGADVLPPIDVENGANGNVNLATGVLPPIEAENGINGNMNPNGTNGNVNLTTDMLSLVHVENATNGDMNSATGVLPPSDTENGIDGNLYSATELKELGISFKKSENYCAFHVVFKNKTMSIPVWEISDSTESLFRNLMAYEHYQTSSPKNM